jgi:hypothetical protein
MNPLETPSPLNPEQARPRREEAARKQQLQLKQQAIKIEQQRQLAARKGNAVAPARPAPAKPEVVKAAVKPAPERTLSPPDIAVAPSPPRAQVKAVALPPIPDPVAPASKHDQDEMRAELAEFAAASQTEEPAAPPAPPVAAEIPEVEATPTKVETLRLKMLKGADLSCPKCHALIPAGQRGAFYTECRRCGEIMKTNAG